MARLKKFLAFYSIAFTAAFAISSPFFFPRPYSLVLTLFLIPLVLYFWIGTTNPSEVGTGKWSIRLLVIVTILTLAGVFSFWLSKNQAGEFSTTPKENLIPELTKTVLSPSPTDSPSASSSSKLEKDVKAIKEDVSEIKAMLEAKNYSLGISTQEDPSVGKLTLASGQTKVDVYDTTKTSAKRVGEILAGNNYFFFKKENGWYQVEYMTDQTGWVKAEYVKEVK